MLDFYAVLFCSPSARLKRSRPCPPSTGTSGVLLMKPPEYFALKYPMIWTSQSWQRVYRLGKKKSHHTLHVNSKPLALLCLCHVPYAPPPYWSDNSASWLSKCFAPHLPDQVSPFAFQIHSLCWWAELMDQHPPPPPHSKAHLLLHSNPLFVFWLLQRGVVARFGEGQIGKQPGRPLRVSAPSHFWLCRRSRGVRLCNNRTVEFLCGPSLKRNAAWYEIFQFIRDNVGESILYLWVEKIREFLVEKSRSADAGEAEGIHGWQTFTLKVQRWFLLTCVCTD